MDKNLILKKLNKAFSSSNTPGGKTTYAHPHEERILEGAVSILKQCKTGIQLVEFKENSNIKVRIMPDQAETGYIPSGNMAYVTAPINTETATPRIVLNLIRALREAMQEDMGYKRPSSNLSKEEFSQLSWEKEQDIIYAMCEVSYELSKNKGLTELIDALNIMGYGEVMEGFIKDFETIS